ncbi:DNA repair protein RecN [Cellulomonas sp. NPDC089187]|uniref:DNA repair protein RecN n=1 Tax=Cellulomonas sp. NPDC089187 TaxID=3154970 RepID=UPI0034167DAD
MFDEITISDLGVIGEARIQLHPGLTVLTGETGAGKTMVLTALNLLLGGKADPATVRIGAESAVVEGRVIVPADSAVASRAQEAGAVLDDDGSLLLVRTVGAGTDGTPGRSRAYLGGRSVPQAVLAELADGLITVHGQMDQTRLRSAAHQRDALDAYAGQAHGELLDEYRQAWAERARVQAEIDDLRSRRQEMAREAELLRLGLAEVERIDPQPGEDVALAAEIERLSHAEDLRVAAAGAHQILMGEEDATTDVSATGAVEQARRLLESGGEHDAQLAQLRDRVAEAGYLLADAATELSSYLQDLQADPARLDQALSRRADLVGLTRSYGEDIEAVLRWSSESATRLLAIDGGDDHLAALAEQRDGLDRRLAELAASLGAARREAAGRLAATVTEELAGLAMAGAVVEVRVEDAGELGPHGGDSVEMLLVPHPGAPARPLGKGASGGELSRVMLALEVALATSPDQGDDRPGTFVFDEVDAGVGGRAATEVGRRLSALATGAQVLVVTHLAQVAAFADRHLVVTKSRGGADGEQDVITASDVREVDGEDRIGELARMLSGDDSPAARAHAAELLVQRNMAR